MGIDRLPLRVPQANTGEDAPGLQAFPDGGSMEPDERLNGVSLGETPGFQSLKRSHSPSMAGGYLRAEYAGQRDQRTSQGQSRAVEQGGAHQAQNSGEGGKRGKRHPPGGSWRLLLASSSKRVALDCASYSYRFSASPGDRLPESSLRCNSH